jgi:hypothetical protein
MLSTRPPRPASALLVLAVTLGVMGLSAALGVTAAGLPAGGPRVSTQPWTAEQAVLASDRTALRDLVERRDQRHLPTPTVWVILGGAIAAALRSAAGRRRSRRRGAPWGRPGRVGARAPPSLLPR